MKMKQSIGLKSIQNVRKLGGYKTADGRMILELINPELIV